MIGQNGLLIVFKETFVVFSEFLMNFVVFGCISFNFGCQLLLFEFVIFYDWFLEFAFEIADLLFIRISIAII